MRISIPKLKLKKDFDRIIVLHWAHFICFALALFCKILYGQSHWGSGILKIIMLAFIYSFYLRTLKNLYYTFWTFTGLISLYFVSTIIISFFNQASFVIIFSALALLFLFWECYLLSSPIFYPLVHWWEYDFRYRHDLKIELTHEGLSFPGRLTDLRRGAGCVVSFDDFPPRKNISIKTVIRHSDEHIDHIILTGELMSKRGNSIGRGFTYGVRFIFTNDQDKNTYKKLRQFWRNERSLRIRKKFAQQKNPEITPS